RCKECFNDAVDDRIITSDPFRKVKAPSQENKERFFFVDLPTIERVIAKCPDSEWRLIVALARYGGLRTPSETLALRWGDVDWSNSRIRVRSPKTERYKGRASREIPLLPELRPYLEHVVTLAAGERGAVKANER